MELQPNNVSDIPQTVCASIAEMLCIPVAEVVLDATLMDLGADSFHFVDVVSRLDARFGIQLPKMYTMPGRYTVQALVHAVIERVKAPSRDARTVA